MRRKRKGKPGIETSVNKEVRMKGDEGGKNGGKL